jgi:hypothetical protein
MPAENTFLQRQFRTDPDHRDAFDAEHELAGAFEGQLHARQPHVVVDRVYHEVTVCGFAQRLLSRHLDALHPAQCFEQVGLLPGQGDQLRLRASAQRAIGEHADGQVDDDGK